MGGGGKGGARASSDLMLREMVRMSQESKMLAAVEQSRPKPLQTPGYAELDQRRRVLAEEEKRKRAAKGRAATILTSGLEPAVVERSELAGKKRILGE